jgi:hypothetical protein
MTDPAAIFICLHLDVLLKRQASCSCTAPAAPAHHQVTSSSSWTGQTRSKQGASSALSRSSSGSSKQPWLLRQACLDVLLLLLQARVRLMQRTAKALLVSGICLQAKRCSVGRRRSALVLR